MPADAGRRMMSSGAIEVRIATGPLQGRIEGDVRIFKGIPYAAPPVGRRRFRHAAPPEPWTGIRPALDFAAAAPQPPDAGLFPGDPNAMPPVPTDEDCLYLNVWAPALEGPHPVLVWLHGGSQIVGGTARPVYDGAVFARRAAACSMRSRPAIPA
jgi:para-nitrobenzyl esterase